MRFTAQSIRKLALILFVVILLAAMAFVLLRAGPMAATRVTVADAAPGRLSPALFGIGTVEARRSYLIGPVTAGRVSAIHVDVGDLVRPAQLLAEMDPVDLDQRIAALDASIARAGSAVSSADAQRRDALAKRDLADINARRYAALGNQNFISASAVEARLQEQASANAGLSGAQSNLAAARQDTQRLAAERAGLRQQRANLRLMAPAAGIITSRDAESGSTVIAGQPVVRLVDPASLWVKVRIDQARSGGLSAGLPASIVLRSDPGHPLAGKVQRVESVSDSVTEERVAMVAFDHPPPGMSLGELAEVTLALPAAATTILLPNASIRRQSGQIGVWRLDDGKLQFVPVQVGQSSLDGQVQVIDGVKEGDRIVVYSDKELAAGMRIKVTESLTGQRP